jgi:selenocysteine-specific translation elongation factor
VDVVGESLSRVLAPGPDAEQSIDAFIERRHAQRVKEEGERRLEEEWKESERKHAAARDAELRDAWCSYHQQQAERHRAVLEALVAHHEQQAERYQLPHARLRDAAT